MGTIRFYLDEHIHPAVAHGLRQRGIDVSTTNDAGLLAASDLEQLEFARNSNRVLVTQDQDFLVHAARGEVHAGIVFVVPRRRAIGQVILALTFLWRQHTAEEMRGRVEFL